MELEGRVALITGAARRVGRAIALRLAAAGCPIALHYHRSRAAAEQTADECRAAGVRVELFGDDLADPDAPGRLIHATLAGFGRLDALVNNAAVFERDNLETLTAASWRRTLDVNLTAPLLLAQAAREALRAARGMVVNLCDAAIGRPMPDYLSYCVSKGGMETLTRVLARALAPEVNVVGVAPGVAAWPDDYDAETRARLTRRIPLLRSGTPDGVAALVHFLLREGDFITGTIIPIDGGRQVR